MKNLNNKKSNFNTKMKSLKLAGFFCLLMTLNCVAQPSNKCLSFNGSNSIVTALNNDLGLNYVNNISVAAWVNWNDKANAGANSIIVTSSDTANSNGQFWLQHNANNSAFQFVIQMDSMSKFTVTGTTNPVAGNWYNVVGVFDGSNVNIYVNGILEASTLVTSGQNIKAFDTTFHYTAGANSQNSGHFNGNIDEVSVWATPLTSSAIQSMMCTKVDSTIKGIVAYSNMDSLNYDTLIVQVTSDIYGDIEIGAIEINCTLVNVGAPVGNNSTYLSGPAPYVYVNPANGDSLLIDSLGSATNGIYIYQVNAAPADSSLPAGVSNLCTPYYYGIFIPAYQGTYSVVYYYDTTSCSSAGHRTSSSSTPVLLDRNAQTSYNWGISNATDDASNSKFRLVAQGGKNEFIMANKINNSTGIANSINNALQVNTISPNPFSTNFNLAITCPKNASIKACILSMDGKLISESTLVCNQGKNQVSFENMGEMASGIYFLNLSDGEGHVTTMKMIKN